MLFNVLLHDAGRVADPNSLSIAIVAINELILIGALNLWLQMKPDGYLSLDILDTPVLPILSPRISLGSDYMHRTNDLAPQDVISLLQTGKVVVANVLKGAHFVLVTGFPSQGPYGNETAWTVNDPASFALFYAHSAVAGWRIFTIAN